MKRAGCSRGSSMRWGAACWWEGFRMRKGVCVCFSTCFLGSMLERLWDFRRQRLVGLVLSGRKRPIRLVQPTLYLCRKVCCYSCSIALDTIKKHASIQTGDLPLRTNHGTESLRAFECVGKVDPATVFTRQLGFLLFLCEKGEKQRKSQQWKLQWTKYSTSQSQLKVTVLRHMLKFQFYIISIHNPRISTSAPEKRRRLKFNLHFSVQAIKV